MLKTHPEIQCTNATSTILLDTVKVVQLPFKSEKIRQSTEIKAQIFQNA